MYSCTLLLGLAPDSEAMQISTRKCRLMCMPAGQCDVLKAACVLAVSEGLTSQRSPKYLLHSCLLLRGRAAWAQGLQKHFQLWEEQGRQLVSAADAI